MQIYIKERLNEQGKIEKLLTIAVKLYTMTSFVHSKIVLTENSAIVGSINMDLRSFNQQFESVVFTNEKTVLNYITLDFINTINHCKQITTQNDRHNKLFYRMLAGLFNLISPFM